MTCGHVALNNTEESLNRSRYIALVNSGFVCYLVDDVGFSHSSWVFVLYDVFQAGKFKIQIGKRK